MKQKQNRIWNGIEKFGNSLPHPVYIFIILTAVVFVVSALPDQRCQNSAENQNARAGFTHQ